MIPKGKLLLIGGAENKGEDDSAKSSNPDFERFEILKSFLLDKKVEIITTASKVPDQIEKRYIDAFKGMKSKKKPGFIHISNREEANDQLLLERINKCECVLFSGGDQYRLTTILGSTPIVDAVLENYMRRTDFILAGTSAGSMAASTLMVYEGDIKMALLKGSVKTTSGLGFIDRCLIDTHFLERGRFTRLAEAVIGNPHYVGFGIGEDAAMLIERGQTATCYGPGMVIVMDGKDIGHSNIAYTDEQSPISAENLIIHVLSKGNGYDLIERRFIPSKEELKMEHNKA